MNITDDEITDESKLNKKVFEKKKGPFKALKSLLMKPIDKFKEEKFQDACNKTYDNFLNYVQRELGKRGTEYIETEFGTTTIFHTQGQGPIVKIPLSSQNTTNTNNHDESPYRIIGFLKEPFDHYMLYDLTIAKDIEHSNPADGVYEAKDIYTVDGYKKEYFKTPAIRISEKSYSKPEILKQIEEFENKFSQNDIQKGEE